MSLFWGNGIVQLHHGDALDMGFLGDRSVDCVVTSPPYWGLRDYGLEPTVWERVEGCEHVWGDVGRAHHPGQVQDNKAVTSENAVGQNQGSGRFCSLCGAWRGNLGLEPTPELYTQHLVQLFREVWRVLKPWGTVWLNLGDSYAGSGGAHKEHHANPGLSNSWERNGVPHWGDLGQPGNYIAPKGLKPKDLVGIPWRVAFALQADGWWLRSDIIWAKPNPMPESVTDRPTKAHEYLFLLTKAEHYYYDQEAIREPYEPASLPRALRGMNENKWSHGAPGSTAHTISKPRINQRKSWEAEHGGGGNGFDGDSGYRDSNGRLLINPLGRNKRSVWTIPTQAYPEAHFACVDAETECLTISGWKGYNELAVGEMAAQFDIVSGTLSWAPIAEVAIYHVSAQPMVVAKSRDVEMVLTPNHRTIIARRHPRTRRYQPLAVIRADGLRPSHAIPVSAPWSVAGTATLSPEWAELLGWYISEGYAGRQGWTVEIYQSQSANPEKVERIRKLLDAVGADYSEAHTSRLWRGRPADSVAFQVRGYVAVYLRELAPEKRLPADVLGWSESCLAPLLDGLIDGDGHRRPDGRASFIQHDRWTADLAQAIAVRLGYATMLTHRSEGTWSLYLTRKRLISFRGTAGEGAEIQTRPYTGVVWCPRLPAGTWVARKNGRAFITGNTFPEALVEPCILAGTSERGNCALCGKPWERVVEHTNMEWTKGTKRMGDDAKGRTRMGGTQESPATNTTVGWQPTCRCGSEDTIPSVVLDPFAGSGTTCAVAQKLGRGAIGVDQSEPYLKLAQKRLEAVPLPLFK